LRGESGPGRDRTCDLGIKSPGGTPAAGGNKLNLAATAAVRLCNKLQLTAGSGDKSVLSFVLVAVGCFSNSSREVWAIARVAAFKSISSRTPLVTGEVASAGLDVPQSEDFCGVLAS
jgi:hypothetical protein